MAHLSRWLAGEGLDASALTAPVAERYFAGRRSAGYANEPTAAALGAVAGLPAGAVGPAPAAGQLLARYAQLPGH